VFFDGAAVQQPTPADHPAAEARRYPLHTAPALA
jgi:hypothetical protein